MNNSHLMDRIHCDIGKFLGVEDNNNRHRSELKNQLCQIVANRFEESTKDDTENNLLRVENQKLRMALNDAIRRPMGVIPASAEGLVVSCSEGQKMTDWSSCS